MTFSFVFLGFLIVIYFVSLLIDWSGVYLFPLVFMMIMMWDMIKTSEERIAQGEYYLKQCRLTETNIDNGFFSSTTHKLNCGGTIVNVKKSDYDKSVSEYKSAAENTP
ncbi:hypothetical protein [Morganella morganii]|nr:hypothetical protein [Morganella morganii]MBT0422644.1 hypothetical protein [Morganella morganii subsp. morganii]MBT0517215.1 hypothetical protein [Morganella morganii subsp. morganii]UNJ79725.1 hypothetical protein [Morganella morganii]